MDQVVIYILRSKLVAAVGSSYKAVLRDLIKEKILDSYDDALVLTFDKIKARHIQALLEFYEVKDIPQGPKHLSKKED